MTVEAVSLRDAIERQRNVVLDHQIAVDDARADVDAVVDRLRDAVRERDREVELLKHLESIEGESATVGARVDGD